MTAQVITNAKATVSGYDIDDAIVVSKHQGLNETSDTSINLNAMRAEFAEIRKMFSEGEEEIKEKRSELNETTQDRLYKLVERGIKQARVLILDENEAVLRELVEGTEDRPGIGAQLAPQRGARLKQIVSLQIGYRATRGKQKGKWMVPARRDERVAHIYAIILQKGWSDEECVEKMKEAGGAAALIKANPKRVSQETEDTLKRRKETVAADSDAPVIPVSSVSKGLVGEFRLAIVSVVEGGIKFHELAPVGSSVREKVVNDFLKDRYRQMLLAAEQRAEAHG